MCEFEIREFRECNTQEIELVHFLSYSLPHFTHMPHTHTTLTHPPTTHTLTHTHITLSHTRTPHPLSPHKHTQVLMHAQIFLR